MSTPLRKKERLQLHSSLKLTCRFLVCPGRVFSLSGSFPFPRASSPRQKKETKAREGVWRTASSVVYGITWCHLSKAKPRARVCSWMPVSLCARARVFVTTVSASKKSPRRASSALQLRADKTFQYPLNCYNPIYWSPCRHLNSSSQLKRRALKK